MRLLALVPLAALLLSNAPATPRKPRPAPAHFVTVNFGLTFRSPAGSTYCPLPPDWLGSDHGTILFLTPPSGCGGVGYPSSSRSWAGAARSHVAVYYGHWFGEDEPPPKPCRRAGTVRLFGKDRPLCRHKDREMVVLYTTARYKADNEYELTLTLATTPKRMNADLATFRTMAASARPCRGMMRLVDEKGHYTGEKEAFGAGAPCPASAEFF